MPAASKRFSVSGHSLQAGSPLIQPRQTPHHSRRSKTLHNFAPSSTPALHEIGRTAVDPSHTGRAFRDRFKLQQMPYMEFYQGLRERNWTSPWYKADAAPWRVQIYQDSGRLLAPAFSGYRRAALRLGL